MLFFQIAAGVALVGLVLLALPFALPWLVDQLIRGLPGNRRDELKQALTTLEMTPRRFCRPRGLASFNCLSRWIASKQIPPHVAWIITLLLERRQLSSQLSAPAE